VYAGTSDGLYRSADQGVSWKPFGQGLDKCGMVNDLAQAPGGTMFALCDDAVFRSTDRGNTWQGAMKLPPRKQR
jgi:photosystem II stability/assembly factor-like uncharacterized protein